MTEVLWNRLTAEELRRKATDDAIVLLPAAIVEAREKVDPRRARTP